MKKRRVVVSCLSIIACVLMCLLSIISFSYAANGIITTSNGYVTQKPYGNLCWAASSVSMVQTKGIHTSVRTHTKKALGTFSNVTRNFSDLSGDFSSIYCISSSQTSTISFSVLESNMSYNKPVMARISWPSGGGHAVVICGTDSSVKGLSIMDPYYGWQYPSYSTFYSGYLGDGKWTNSIVFN